MKNLIIDSPLNGELIELTKVGDKIFSSGAAGSGSAIKNPDGKISAPFDGVIKFLASPGVIGLKSFDGAELLIHVGLNTCKFIGESFKPQITAGDTIKRGQILLTFDPQEMICAGFETTTPVVVTNPENFGEIIFRRGEQKIIAKASASEKFSARKLFCDIIGAGAFEMDKNPEQQNNQDKTYLTSENSPELKKEPDKISAELLERNKKLYQGLANAC